MSFTELFVQQETFPKLWWTVLISNPVPTRLGSRTRGSSSKTCRIRVLTILRVCVITCGKLIMRLGIMDSSNLRGIRSQSEWAGISKQQTGNRKWSILPAAHLHWLHVKVRPQDVDVCVQVKRSGRLALSCLPHLQTLHWWWCLSNRSVSNKEKHQNSVQIMYCSKSTEFTLGGWSKYT